MTRQPIIRTATACCRYSELLLGDELSDALTITEAHVVLAAGLFDDHGPNHVNALQAAVNRFGARIAHGPLLIGVMDGVLGKVLGSSIIALLEQEAVFRNPVFLGDTVLARWQVTERVDKPRFGGGGIVTFTGHAENQDNCLLADMKALLAVAEGPVWKANEPSHTTAERSRKAKVQ